MNKRTYSKYAPKIERESQAVVNIKKFRIEKQEWRPSKYQKALYDMCFGKWT